VIAAAGRIERALDRDPLGIRPPVSSVSIADLTSATRSMSANVEPKRARYDAAHVQQVGDEPLFGRARCVR